VANRSKRTKSKEKKILDCLRSGGTIKEAVEAGGIGRTTLFEWKSEDPEFAALVEAAIEDGTDALEGIARDRAKEKSDLLLMFILKKRRPEFRDNHQVQVEAGDNLTGLFDAIRQSAQAAPPEPTPNQDQNEVQQIQPQASGLHPSPPITGQ
jgi:hypothetical protein